mgnify:CR=1 FL=1
MKQIQESELILNKDGSVYHLNLLPEELAETVINVGDPDRVEKVSAFFSSIEIKKQKREFVTHTGYYNNQRITVLSTGIGTDNIDIVLNELDALANIDFETRTIKPTHTKLTIVRMGTSGSLQASIPVDSFVASTHGLGIDNLLNFYKLSNNEEELQILQSFNVHTQIGQNGLQPYIAAASTHILKEFVTGFHQGITVTCPGFYGPQGRILRLPLQFPDLINQLTHFQFGQHRISNFEMETSAIYGLGKLLNHNCLSLSAIVANRVEQTFSKDGGKAVESLIVKSIEILSTIK